MESDNAAGNPTPFPRREPALCGHFYDYTGERNVAQYVETTEQLSYYVGSLKQPYTHHFLKAIDSLELPSPDEDVDESSPLAMVKWEIAYKEYQAKKQAFAGFQCHLYCLVLGQCTPALVHRLHSHANFPELDESKDGLALLALIRDIACGVQHQRALLDC